jgi:hypothetical protein
MRRLLIAATADFALAARGALLAGREFFMRLTGAPALSHQTSVNVLDNLRQEQAESSAYFDVFW